MGKHDIGWAVDRIKAGDKVRRPHWGEGFYVYMYRRVVLTPEGKDVNVAEIYINMPSLNRVQPFTCHHDDLLADDWQLA